MLGEGIYTDICGHGHTHTLPEGSSLVGLAGTALLPSPLCRTQAAGSMAGLACEAKKGESKKLAPLTHCSSANVPLWAGGFQGVF